MATVTDSQLLNAARSALLKRLNGDAYESYTTAEQQFQGMPVEKLQLLVERLERKLAAASSAGGAFRLIEGF